MHLLALLLLTAGPRDALASLVEHSEHLTAPATVRAPGGVGATTCFGADEDSLAPLLAQVRAPLIDRLQTGDELLTCARGKLRKDERCELTVCGTLPLGDRTALLLGVKWRDNLPDEEHYNSRNSVFALTFSQAGRLIDGVLLSEDLRGAGTLEANGRVRFRTNGGDESDVGRLMPSGRFCKAPVKDEPMKTWRDAKSGESLQLGHECGAPVVAYRAKPGKPLQWLVVLSADDQAGTRSVRFEASPTPYALELKADTLTCTEQGGKPQTFTAEPDPQIH